MMILFQNKEQFLLLPTFGIVIDMAAFGLPSHLPFMAYRFACIGSRAIDTRESLCFEN